MRKMIVLTLILALLTMAVNTALAQEEEKTVVVVTLTYGQVVTCDEGHPNPLPGLFSKLGDFCTARIPTGYIAEVRVFQGEDMVGTVYPLNPYLDYFVPSLWREQILHPGEVGG